MVFSKNLKKVLIIILVIISIIVFLVLSLTESKSFEVPYSTYNTDNNGTKALYYLCKKMGYDVERYKRPAMFLPDNILMVMIKPYVEFYSDKEQKYLKSWIEKGNKLLIVEENEVLFDSFLFEEAVSKKGNGFFEFTLSKGKIIVLIEPDSFINKKVFSNEENAIQFMNTVDSTEVESILFNEYYHGFGKKSVGLFDILNAEQIFIIIQLILIILVFLYTKSKRFGTPELEFDLENRIENENIFALSNVIYKSRLNLVVLSVYKNLFKEDLKKYLDFDYDELILEKREIKIKDYSLNNIIKKIEKFYEESNRKNLNSKKKRKEICNLVREIELIRSCLNNVE